MFRNNENKGQQDPIPSSPAQAELWEMQADICQTLANPKRLQVINLLKEQELSVGAMVKVMGVAKANLSQHLSVMRQKGILATRREGTTIYYRLAIPYITEACAIMREVLLQVLDIKGKLSQSWGAANRTEEEDQAEDLKI
jgi:ArsR family transcriptional regulator, virulence genes transcriptional regulator